MYHSITFLGHDLDMFSERESRIQMKSEPSECRGGGEGDLPVLMGEDEWGVSGFLLPHEVDQFQFVRVYFHTNFGEQVYGIVISGNQMLT